MLYHRLLQKTVHNCQLSIFYFYRLWLCNIFMHKMYIYLKKKNLTISLQKFYSKIKKLDFPKSLIISMRLCAGLNLREDQGWVTVVTLCKISLISACKASLFHLQGRHFWTYSFRGPFSLFQRLKVNTVYSLSNQNRK